MKNEQHKKSPNITVTVKRHFGEPAEKVFDAWLDPKTAGKWFFATPGGKMVRTEIDARVGGKFIFTDKRDGEEIEHAGKYEAIDRPHRLVFKFGVPKYTGKDTTRVSIDIMPNGKGCDLTLTHEGVWPDYEERTKQGWTMMLGKLADTLK
jgi:uncharacterized protein YndB with AHSA1/START domain